MKSFKTVLFFLLVGVVGFVAAIADAGESTAVSNGTTLTTTTTTSIFTSTIPVTASNGLTFHPARNTTALCNNSVTTVTVTKEVSFSFYFIETITEFLSDLETAGNHLPPVANSLSRMSDCLNSPTSASTDTPFPSVSSDHGTITTHPTLNATHLPIGNLSHFARRNSVPHPRPLPIINITATPDASETASTIVVSPLAHSVTSDNDTTTVFLTVTAQSTVFVDLEDPSDNQTFSSSLTSGVAADETAGTSSSLSSSSVSVAVAPTSGMMNNVTTTSTFSSIIASKTTTITVQTTAVSASSMSFLMSAALSTYAGAQSSSSTSTHAVDAVSLSAVATLMSLNHSSAIASELSTSPVTSLVNTSATEHHTFSTAPHFVNISTFVASGLHISSMVASASNNGSDTLPLSASSSSSSGSVDTSFPIIVSTAVQESNHHTTRHAASSTTVSTVTAAASTTTATGAAARAVQPPRVFAHIAHVALAFVNAIKLTHADANLDAGSAPAPAPCGNANNATFSSSSCGLGSGQDITATISMTQTHYSTTTVHATRTLTATHNTTAIVKTPSMAHPTSSITSMTTTMATHDSSASVLALSAVGSLVLVGLGFWFIF